MIIFLIFAIHAFWKASVLALCHVISKVNCTLKFWVAFCDIWFFFSDVEFSDLQTITV